MIAIAAGFALGKNAIVFLSKSPSGMEDIPPDVKVSLEEYSQELGFEQILIIDSHNSMGEQNRKTGHRQFYKHRKKMFRENNRF